MGLRRDFGGHIWGYIGAINPKNPKPLTINVFRVKELGFRLSVAGQAECVGLRSQALDTWFRVLGLEFRV